MESNSVDGGIVAGQRLDGRTAIVTGSSGGIGQAIVEVLAEAGAEVLVTGRDQARTKAVAKNIESSGGRAHALTVDLAAPPDDIREWVRHAVDLLGGQVDILVNNAGVYPGSTTELLSDADLEALLAVNIRAPHVLVAELAPAMAERGRGAIVNIGSWMARVGTPNKALYPATKAAIEQLTRGWAAEYGPRGVRVNTVAPGATASMGNEKAAAILEAMAARTVAGRPVQPRAVANAVRFAVSDEAEFLHGSTIDVDGGIAHTRLS